MPRGDVELNKTGYRGFTLVELLVVLVIVGILAALVAPSVYQRINPAKATGVKAQMQAFMTGLDNYFVDVGSFPDSRDGLAALVQQPPGAKQWNGPYLKKGVPNDPWGNAYIYRTPGRMGPFEIVSFGADGREGGEGEAKDIYSWEND